MVTYKTIVNTKLLTNRSFRLCLIVLALAGIGLFLLRSTQAATFVVALEAESGQVSGTAQTLSGQVSASNSQAIQFGATGNNNAEYLANEQFNGTSLSGTQWVAKSFPKGYRNSEEQDYRPEQAKVENGNLVITASKDGSGWHSAEVESTWRLRYGSYETRMRTSAAAKGMWPAAWLLSNSWPGDGEVDIMEAVNADPTVWGSLHGGPTHWNHYKTHTPVDVSQWHTYRMDITTGAIAWYVDGVKRGDFNKSMLSGGQNWPFDSKDYYGILNLAMGGTWPEATDSSTPNPLILYVDYFTVKKIQ